MCDAYLMTIYSGFDSLNDEELDNLESEIELNNFMEEVAEQIENALLDDFGF